jgi:hypothetical protein
MGLNEARVAETEVVCTTRHSLEGGSKDSSGIDYHLWRVSTRCDLKMASTALQVVCQLATNGYHSGQPQQSYIEACCNQLQGDAVCICLLNLIYATHLIQSV